MLRQLNFRYPDGRGRIGRRDCGIRGDQIPSSGGSMPAWMFPSLALPADAAKRYAYWITAHNFPLGLPLADDSSGFIPGLPDGTYTATLLLEEDGVLLPGSFTATVTVGTPPPPPPPPPPALVAMPQYTLGAPEDQILIVGGTASLAPGQRGLIAFDFRRYTSAPLNPVVTVLHESGAVDPSPASIKQGSPQVQGTKVFQYVESAIDEANYTLICQAEGADGQEFLIAGRLPIRRLS